MKTTKNTSLIQIIKNTEKNNVSKDWIIENIHSFDLREKNTDGVDVFYAILDSGKFNKNDILPILDNLNLKEINRFDGLNALMYILSGNKVRKLGFLKKDIFDILDRFDLKDTDNWGWNALMYIIDHNGIEEFKFTKNEILGLLDRFNLSQKTTYGRSIYCFLKNNQRAEIEPLNEEELCLVMSKLPIEMTNEKNQIILVQELNNGMKINNDILIKKILETENKEIVDCVYKHIEQIQFKDDILLRFIQKNNLEINEKINNILTSL